MQPHTYPASNTMSSTERRRQLIERISALTEESYRLPATQDGWQRREAIEWELILLFREIAAHSDGPPPYWSQPPASASARQASDRPPVSPTLSVRQLIYGSSA